MNRAFLLLAFFPLGACTNPTPTPVAKPGYVVPGPTLTRVEPGAQPILDAWAEAMGGRDALVEVGALYARGSYEKGGLRGTIDLCTVGKRCAGCVRVPAPPKTFVGFGHVKAADVDELDCRRGRDFARTRLDGGEIGTFEHGLGFVVEAVALERLAEAQARGGGKRWPWQGIGALAYAACQRESFGVPTRPQEIPDAREIVACLANRFTLLDRRGAREP